MADAAILDPGTTTLHEPEDALAGVAVVLISHEWQVAVVGVSPGLRGRLRPISADDMRRVLPRFQGDALAQNLGLVRAIEAIAKAGGGAIVSQTLKLILGTIGAVGNFFIVMFLGLAFAGRARRKAKKSG